MALNPVTPPTHSPALQDRFLIAQGGPPPSEEQLAFQLELKNKIFAVAATIDTVIADSREKALALTKLEEALMWAGKAIFKD